MEQQKFTEKIKTFYTKVIHWMRELILSPFRLLRFLCLITGGVVLSVTFFVAIMVFNFFHSMPDIDHKNFDDLKKDAIARVHRKYKTLDERKKYFWTPIKKINRELLYSIVMSEDATYFEHNGVNFNAMIDSLARNIRKREYSSGASTITQQVVKNVYLTNEKSIIRKLKEILIARDLESKFSKNEILEVYLNLAEFGPNVYGVGMASYRFFGHAPVKVSALEGAFMGLMLPSPRRNYFSIFNNKYLNKKNRNKMIRVLRDMRYLEFLSPDQYKKYRKMTPFKDYQS